MDKRKDSFAYKRLHD